jgi:hypothetical protein
MRHLQTYRLFESEQTLTQDQKNLLNDYTRGSWSINPSTGLVDIKGDFNCSNSGLKDLEGIRFGVVTGNFSCHTNYLTSLVGAPQTVGGHFICKSNRLTSLEGAPQTVGEYFSCNENMLTSLAGAPQTVGGSFSCNVNKLTSLEGAPQTVGEDFSCNENMLTSLAGAPQTVGGSFSCNVNKLTSLAGTPQIIKGGLNCNGNKLTSLEGAPEAVGGSFACFDNELTSLAGAPETVGGKFYSEDLTIPRGKWGIETFVDLLKTGTSKQKQLVATLVDPKVLQQQIDQNPEGMLVNLKGYLKHPHFQNLEWPKRLEGEADLLSDLSDVGL